MAFGELSAEQRRYRDRVAARTGLDRDVVTAWIAAESGWQTTKPGHNYLNIGPGRTYPSVNAAADAVAVLVNGSDHYAGIRAARRRSGLHQIRAIGSSPWDAGRYGGDGSNLERVYRQLVGMDPATPPATPIDTDDNGGGLGDWANPFTPHPSTPRDGWDALSDQGLRFMLTGILTVAGLGLVLLGVFMLTRRPLIAAGKAAAAKHPAGAAAVAATS